MTSLIKKRNRYYSMRYTYYQRRRELRIKFNLNPDWPTRVPQGYNKIAGIYNRKIKHWTRLMKRLDRIRDEIIVIEKAVKRFIDIPTLTGNARYNTELQKAKWLYYKIGLESGYQGKDLREHIKAADKDQPARCRTKFTKSFQTKPENKELWLRFKRFYERGLEAESNRFISTKKTA